MPRPKKKATVKTFFGGNKLDEAADLFGRAGNAFKLKKQCRVIETRDDIVVDTYQTFFFII
jgi:hypothetical protein